MKKKTKCYLPILLFSAVFLVVLLRNAWVTDDAYITFRVIENFIRGHGPVYNLGYRVQSFTHPLWMVMLTGLYYIALRLGGTAFWTGLYDLSLMLSLVLSMAAVLLMALHIARSARAAVLGMLVLVLSKAFIDYATSGLENPLTYFLIALFMLVYLQKERQHRVRMLLLALIASLAALNRMDTVLLFIPALLVDWWQNEKRWTTLGWMALGFTPLIVWEVFSLLYYGFPFPNTYYAKLTTGALRVELMRQGFFYLFHSIDIDPLTLVFSIYALALVLFNRKRQLLPLAAGALLYQAYVVYIGGDFMSGRFLAAPLFLMVCLTTQYKMLRRPTYHTLLIATAVIGLLSPNNPLLSDSTYGSEVKNFHQVADQNRVTDERAFYYQILGLLPTKRTAERLAGHWDWDAWQVDPAAQTVVEINSIGRAGYEGGPNMHVVDYASLADPLLARLPIPDRRYWIIGHFNRNIPGGYIETLESGENRIEDPSLNEYYDSLSLIIQGDIWDSDRLATIWKINTGQYDYLVEEYVAGLKKKKP